MDKFLAVYSPPKLNQEEIGNLNRLMSRSEIESVIIIIIKTPYKQNPRTRCLVQDKSSTRQQCPSLWMTSVQCHHFYSTLY